MKRFLICLIVLTTVAVAAGAQAWEGVHSDPSGVTIRWQQAGGSEDGVVIKVENASDEPYAVKFVSEDERISRVPMFAGLDYSAPTEWDQGVIPPHGERVEWYTIRMIKPRRIIEVRATPPGAADFRNSLFAAARGLRERERHSGATDTFGKSSDEYDRDYAQLLLGYLEQGIPSSYRSQAVRGHGDFLSAAKEVHPRLASLQIADLGSQPARQGKRTARPGQTGSRQDLEEEAAAPRQASGKRAAKRRQQPEDDGAAPPEHGDDDAPAAARRGSQRDGDAEADWSESDADRGTRGGGSDSTLPPSAEPEPDAAESGPVVQWNQPSQGAQAPESPDEAAEEPDPAAQGATPPGAAPGSPAAPLPDPSYQPDDPFYRNVATAVSAVDRDDGASRLDPKDLKERFSDWCDDHVKPLAEEVKLVAKETVAALYDVTKDKVMNGDDIEPKEIVKEAIDEKLKGMVNMVKDAVKDVAKTLTLQAYFDYSARAKYGKAYSELDDAEKLDVHWLKAAANMIFTPVRALVTRNITGAGDAHGTEMGFLGDTMERGFTRHDSQ